MTKNKYQTQVIKVALQQLRDDKYRDISKCCGKIVKMCDCGKVTK